MHPPCLAWWGNSIIFHVVLSTSLGNCSKSTTYVLRSFSKSIPSLKSFPINLFIVNTNLVISYILILLLSSTHNLS